VPGAISLLKELESKKTSGGLTLAGAFLIMTILTARSSYQASFINYDNAKEFLVYAHGADGPKQILSQVKRFLQGSPGGKDIKVAYIGDCPISVLVVFSVIIPIRCGTKMN